MICDTWHMYRSFCVCLFCSPGGIKRHQACARCSLMGFQAQIYGFPRREHTSVPPFGSRRSFRQLDPSPSYDQVLRSALVRTVPTLHSTKSWRTTLCHSPGSLSPFHSSVILRAFMRSPVTLSVKEVVNVEAPMFAALAYSEVQRFSCATMKCADNV